MKDVPQIVRERLRATPSAVNHPDADALTAFAERSLRDSERALVLEHLARCGDCRDIVALALPELDAAHAVTVPARSNWLTWPTLRWGFAVAGIVLIASFGVLRYQDSKPAMTVAKQSRQQDITAKVQSPPAANTLAREPQKTVDAAQPSAKGLAVGVPPSSPEPKLSFRAAPPTVPAPPSRGAVGAVIGGQVGYGPHMPTQQQQQTTANPLQAVVPAAPAAKQQNAGASANLRAPSVSETVNVQAAAAQFETRQDEAQLQNQPSVPSPSTGQLFDKDESSRVDKVGKAKPASNTTGRDVMQLVALTPRWAINPAGGLQRSFDQGQTWQDVDVTAGAALSAGAKSLTAAKAARTKEYYADKKTLKVPASAPLFRAVAVTGPDVWAGGSEGVLYHSVDSGNHWVQVVPAAAGITLTGDIVGLVFSDAQQGRITTSTGEIWTTSDQGQTWQKQ
jgi:Photosynthesis system II assembly factor YCF48